MELLTLVQQFTLNLAYHHPVPSYISPHIQASSVSIFTHNNIPITVSTIYCPPGLITIIDHFSDYFATLGHSFISGGEFNVINTTWGIRSPNTRGRTLQCCINNNNFSSLALLGPTYWPSHNNRLPDILIFLSRNYQVTYTSPTSTTCLPIKPQQFSN